MCFFDNHPLLSVNRVQRALHCLLIWPPSSLTFTLIVDCKELMSQTLQSSSRMATLMMPFHEKGMLSESSGRHKESLIRDVKSAFDVGHYEDLCVVCSQTTVSLVWLSMSLCWSVFLIKFISADSTSLDPRHSFDD